MQVMNDDARAVSAVTGLKLQMAGDVDAPVVLGGFPKSGLDAYVGKLARAGHSVALAFQDSDKERHLREEPASGTVRSISVRSQCQGGATEAPSVLGSTRATQASRRPKARGVKPSGGAISKTSSLMVAR